MIDPVQMVEQSSVTYLVSIAEIIGSASCDDGPDTVYIVKSNARLLDLGGNSGFCYICS